MGIRQSGGEGWESAIEIIEGEHVDLVILDLAIPGKHRFDVLDQVTRFSRTPIIVLSARHESDVKVKCLSLELTMRLENLSQ